MQDLVAEYQQYQDATYVYLLVVMMPDIDVIFVVLRRKESTRRRFP